ncbi:UvrD-helicase domain-containing protein [Terriglobus sp.]|uniref:UvrD-helicase domain-containing protein n=1 Tax=Terriglobus sp. TaxID=1889013 RepID=UPI003AFF776F
MSATILEFPALNHAPTVPEVADARERCAALNPEQSFLVEAPAGSGKTGLLVQRLLKLLCRVERPESVLALTFTNKATAEMRERVLKALDLVPRDPDTLSDFDRTTRDLATDLLHHDRAHGWNLQQNSHRLNIRTIDSLCGEIARSLPLSAGAIGQMTPVENAMPLYRRAARAVTLRLGDDNHVLNDALRTVLLRRDADLQNCEALLAQMLSTREQWGRLIPLTPGELTDEFLDREVKPRLDRTLESIVCGVLTTLQQTFPADLLDELTGLASQLAQADGYNGSDNPFAPCANLRTPPGTHHSEAEHWALLARLLLNASSPYSWRKSMAVNHLGFVTNAPQKKRLLALIEALSTNDTLHAQLCNLRNLPPASMPAEDWHMTKALFHLLHFALLELHTIFRDTKTCDFTERSIAARAALESTEPGQAARALESMDLQHLLVDEMQDTSSAQYELLEALTNGWGGQRRTVFLVGDPKQSIYLFRQARVERFLSSMQSGSLGGVPLTTLRLTTNFRSSAPLVREFNQIFGPIFQAAGDGAIPYTAATASRTAEAGKLHWHIDPLWGDHGHESRRDSRKLVQREQAAHIVHTIHHLREEAPAGSPPTFAVLVRAREHAAPITRLLRESGIPFRGVELEPLDERPEVLDTLALTRALLHPADRVAWLAVLRAPWCGTTLADLHHLAAAEAPGSRTRAPRRLFREHAATLLPAARTRILRTLDTLDEAVQALGRMPLAELVERTGRALGTDLFRTDAERTNVRRFLELLEQAEAELRPLDADDLQTRLARLYAEPDTTPGAVDIMTIHKAKGLEWDVVFVPELQRASAGNSQRLLDWLEVPATSPAQAGVLLAPIPPRGTKAAELACFVQTARRRQEQAEVARLLYVVTTRARKQLHLYAAPALKKDSNEVIHPSGTLLDTAWAAAASLIQAEAAARQKTPGELELLQANADDAAEVTRELADLRRVPDGFDPAALQRPLVLSWLHAKATEIASAAGLEQVDRPEGSLTARALGTAVHLFLDQLAQRLATNSEASPNSLLAAVNAWPNRIRATLRSMGTHGTALERDTASVLLALRNTIQLAEGLWLLRPHARATTEQALTLNDSTNAAARTLRLDRSFIAGPHPGSNGTDTLWIIDYKTATAGATPTEDFLKQQREHYAPQLRNYARLLAANASTPQRIVLALFYPMLPALDTWLYQPNE